MIQINSVQLKLIVLIKYIQGVLSNVHCILRIYKWTRSLGHSVKEGGNVPEKFTNISLRVRT